VRWYIAVTGQIAAGHLKIALRIGKLPFFNIFHPGSVNPERNFVFRFAGSTAGVTTDAGLVVNHKAIVH
jgi:hypothetical protein